jgi:hypothetical protein
MVFAAIVCARIADATVLLPADVGDLAREARTIARGRVVAVQGRWTDDRRSIETLVTLEVETYLKGSLGATLQFAVPGGRLGRYQRIVIGAPDFAVDQRVIVFLGGQGPSLPFVLGFSQGVFRVSPSADGLSSVVTPSPLFPATATTAVVRGDPARRTTSLADFEQRVRSLAGGAR